MATYLLVHTREVHHRRAGNATSVGSTLRLMGYYRFQV
jgi:hypothetical protein